MACSALTVQQRRVSELHEVWQQLIADHSDDSLAMNPKDGGEQLQRQLRQVEVVVRDQRRQFAHRATEVGLVNVGP